jgi:hypothetical protein
MANSMHTHLVLQDVGGDIGQGCESTRNAAAPVERVDDRAARLPPVLIAGRLVEIQQRLGDLGPQRGPGATPPPPT